MLGFPIKNGIYLYSQKLFIWKNPSSWYPFIMYNVYYIKTEPLPYDRITKF